MKVRKEIIRPGTYTYIDPKTDLPAKLTVTPAKIKHYHDQGVKMLKAGLSIPLPMEHQPDARPVTQSEKAAQQLKDNAGWTEKFEIGEVTEDKKKIKDVLFGIFDVPDPETVKKLPTTIKFTSPWINSFTDGTGKRWDNVISHVALTTRPRITKQQPFGADMAAALSLVTGLVEKPTEEMPLSPAGLMIKEKGKLKPKYPMAFSMLTNIKLSKEEMKEIEDEGDDEAPDEPEATPGGGSEEPEVPGGEEDGGRESPLDNVGDSYNDVTIHECIGHLLHALGFSPPDGMSEKTFERDVYETLMAKVQEMGGTAQQPEEEIPEEPMEQPNTPSKNPVIEESPQMYASLDEIKKIPDAKERQLQERLFNITKRADSIALAVTQAANVKRKTRLDAIAKKLPKIKHEAFFAMANAPSMQLSVGDAGTVVDPMEKTLELMEAMQFDPKEYLLKPGVKLSEEAHPTDGKESPEEIGKKVEDFIKRTGGTPIK